MAKPKTIKENKQTDENYKTKIAEILFNSDAPTDIVMWALSHLPDKKTKGKNNAIVFNHEEEIMYKAVGISSRDWSKYGNKVLKLVQRIHNEQLKFSSATSEAFEESEKDTKYRLWAMTNLICFFSSKVKEDLIKQDVLKAITQSIKKKKK